MFFGVVSLYYIVKYNGLPIIIIHTPQNNRTRLHYPYQMHIILYAFDRMKHKHTIKYFLFFILIIGSFSFLYYCPTTFHLTMEFILPFFRLSWQKSFILDLYHAGQCLTHFSNEQAHQPWWWSFPDSNTRVNYCSNDQPCIGIRFLFSTFFISIKSFFFFSNTFFYFDPYIFYSYYVFFFIKIFHFFLYQLIIILHGNLFFII